MTTDIDLRFPDQDTALALLYVAGGLVIADAGEAYVHRNTDIIGAIDGAEGFHANVRLVDGEVLADSLLLYVIPKPKYPKRVWA